MASSTRAEGTPASPTLLKQYQSLYGALLHTTKFRPEISAAMDQLVEDTCDAVARREAGASGCAAGAGAAASQAPAGPAAAAVCVQGHHHHQSSSLAVGCLVNGRAKLARAL